MAELDDFDDLDDLDALDDLEGLEDLDDLGFDDPQPVATAGSPAQGASAPPAAAAAASGLGAMLKDLFEKRNFQQILQIAQTQQDAIRSDAGALAIVQAAQTKLESESYIKAFLKAASQAWEAGQLEEMNANLKKARSLDPEHPEVLRFTQLLSQTSAQVAAAPPQAAAAPPPAAPPPPAPAAAPPPPADSAPDILSFDTGETPLTFGDEEPLDLRDEIGGELADEEPAEEPIADDPDDFLLDDFSLEESQEPAAAPPPPVAEEPPPAPVDAGGEEEGGDRIAQLLAEGKEVFDRGEYQSAIDVWSRIFLIDIDNAEASGLIEEARSKKAEIERQAEEVFHEAVGHIESQSLEEAKESLRRVLELQESHSIARDYLQQLEAGKVPSVSSSTSEGADDTDLGDLGLAAGGEESPSMEAAVERDRVVVVKRTDRKLVLLGALVSVLVIGGGAFLASQWDNLFPNQAEAPPAPGLRQVDPIEKATTMHEGGQTENAINLLERIQPGDPNYENAQALVAQWKALVEAPADDTASGPSQEQVARWQVLLDAARDAHGQRRFIRAQKLFDRAAKILPLEASDQALKIESATNLLPLKSQLERFRAGEYAEILPSLWRLRESEPENKDVESLIIDSYYNLALTDLQRGDALSAADKMQEVLEVAPNNTDLRRLLLFSRTYMDRPHDLLFRIYVKYLPPRN